MKKESLWQAVKYTLFSVSAGVIQAVSFTLLFEVLLRSNEGLYWVCHIVALILSILWNFTLNRKYTFQSATNVPIAMLKVAAFYAVFAPLSAWWMDYFTGIGWNEYLVQICTMLLNFVLEYLYQRFFVFGNSLDTAKTTARQTDCTENIG